MAGAKTSSQPASSNPAAERIRENQRRSRARRKEFVEGMQRRLDEYERQGVEATMQMQQAARTVALENARLRMLLARRGVAPDEVDKFLAMFETGVAKDDDELLPAAHHSAALQLIPHVAAQPPPPVPQQQQQQQPQPQQHYTTAAAATAAPTQPSTATTATYQPHTQYHSDGGIDRLAVLADASISDRCCGSSGPTCVTTPSESTVAAQSPPSTGPSTMPSTPVSASHGQYHSHPHASYHHHSSQHDGSHRDHDYTTPQRAPPASPLVMSCNTAAQIIAEMQGGAPVNKHAVKARLGCEDDECECFVKNTLLFQIMEKNAA